MKPGGGRTGWGDVPLRVRDEVIPGAALFKTAGDGMAYPGAGAQGHASRADVMYEVTTPEEVRAAVEDYVRMKPEFIKIWVDDREGRKPTLPPALYRVDRRGGAPPRHSGRRPQRQAFRRQGADARRRRGLAARAGARPRCGRRGDHHHRQEPHRPQRSSDHVDHARPAHRLDEHDAGQLARRPEAGLARAIRCSPRPIRRWRSRSTGARSSARACASTPTSSSCRARTRWRCARPA